MTWEILFVLALLVFAVVSFILEKISADVTALTVFSVILVVSFLSESDALLSLNEILKVFSNPAPITIAGMFMISAALEKSGAIDTIANSTAHLTRLGYRQFILILILGIALVSAFVNNTPIVVIFLPVILSLSRNMKVPASKLLIPLSYASIFGGTCTLVGSSTNILMSGIIKENGQPPLKMFELAAIGLPLLGLGAAYLIFFGRKVLPVRETLTSILSEEERKEYISEAYVRKGSQLVGQSFKESGLLKKRGIRLLEIIRNGVALEGSPNTQLLKERDRLILACRPSGIVEAHSLEGITFSGRMGEDLETITAHEGSVVEGVIGPNSSLVGKTLREINFRQRYRMILLAIHRRGKNVRERLETLNFEFGDTLLMMGTSMAIDNLRKSNDIILLDRPSLPILRRKSKMPIVLAVMGAIIATVSFNLLPIVVAVLLGVTFLFITGCIKPKDGYAAVEWRILVLIYGMLCLGFALEKSGATLLITENLIKISTNPYVVIAAIYLMTAILTEFLSNNATVVLMAPISLSVATTLGVDPRPFIIATCIASSASFITPVGYQTNTYVYGVGGYRFTDFAKAGAPLALLYFLGSTLLIPRIWPF